MQKAVLAATAVVLVALLAFWGVWTAQRRAAAADANARQVQELMEEAKSLDLPPAGDGADVGNLCICHCPFGSLL